MFGFHIRFRWCTWLPTNPNNPKQPVKIQCLPKCCIDTWNVLSVDLLVQGPCWAMEQWSIEDMLILYPANQSNPTQPNPTQPNPTQPNPTQPNPTQPNPTQPNPTHQPTNQPTNCRGSLWSQPFRISHDSTSLQVREGEGLSGFLWPGVDEIVVVVVVLVGLVVWKKNMFAVVQFRVCLILVPFSEWLLILKHDLQGPELIFHLFCVMFNGDMQLMYHAIPAIMSSYHWKEDYLSNFWPMV